MNLTKDQGRLLEEGTPAQRKAMEILLALGEIGGAESLVPITSAHVSGASYKLIGDAGLEFIEDFAAGTRVAVPTTVNPLGTDLDQWRELGIPEAFAEKQARIARAYEAMGTRTIFSCTPYEQGVRPGLGEHVAWAESNATCFANSVLGARTNREGGPSALAASIVGATANYGLHLDAGRQPTHVLDVRTKVRGFGFSLLGLFAGKVLGDGLPFVRGLVGGEDDLKWFGAALASSGSVGMFHLERRTPEWRKARTRGLPTVRVTKTDLDATKAAYTTADDADLIALGAPQLSAEELREIAAIVDRRAPRIPVWVFTSRAAREACPAAVATIERHGGRG